jgi:hypothetical protein
VRIDGVLVATVDLAAPTTTPRHVVYRRSLGPPGRHVVEIRSLDVPARSLVEVDAFLVVRNGTADPVIVGAGDIASCSRTSDTATAVVMDEVVGTVVTMGDNVYDNGTPTEFRECYEPTWGRVKARTRPTPGNHDYGTSGAAGYFGYFGAAAGTSSKSWYAYDLGSWRVYALDSDCSYIGGCGEGSPQLTWLRADLAANPRKCTIAMWHHARFSSGIHGNNPVSEPLFAALHAAGAMSPSRGTTISTSASRRRPRQVPRIPPRASGSGSSAPEATGCTRGAPSSPTARSGTARATGS